MKNYTKDFETPAEAMAFMNIDNDHETFNAFMNRTYYFGGVATKTTKMDNGDTMVKACYYCNGRESFVVDVEIIK